MTIVGKDNQFDKPEQDALARINDAGNITFMSLTTDIAKGLHAFEEVLVAEWIHPQYTYVVFSRRHADLVKLWAKNQANFVPTVLVNGKWEIEYDFLSNYSPENEYHLEQHLVDHITNNCV